MDSLVATMMSKSAASGRWSCVPCATEFRDKTDLRRHVESKHVDAEVICPICSNSYKTRETFSKHMAKKHPEVAFNTKKD